MALLVEQPAAIQAQALAQLQMRALKIAALVAAVLSLLGGAAMLLITRPLRRLRRSAAALVARTLSLPLADSHRRDEIGQIVASLTRLWHEQKTAADHARADAIRDQLAAAGIQLEDGPEGTRWRRG
jgi:cysteinyl-tRNA synthetase